MRMCDKQEKRVCKGLGGKRQVGSGATPFLKGDGVLDDLLIECKTKDTPSKSIAVKKAWFDKLKEEAFSMGKDGGILVFSFGDGEDYVAEDYNTFKMHYEAHRQLEKLRGLIELNTVREGLERRIEANTQVLEEILNILEE